MAKEFELDLGADSLPPEEIKKKITRSRDRIITAPVIIILCVDMSDMDTYPDTRRKKAEYLMASQSAAGAGMQLLLAAHAEGLGGVWVLSLIHISEPTRPY